MRILLENLKLPKDAIDWLVMLYDSIQVFDDYADGDKVSRKDLNVLIWNTLISMPMNSFFIRNSNVLCSAMAIAILKWQASDTVERQGFPSAMSFAWRAGYYDIILLVYAIHFGHVEATKNAHHIMALYGEQFDKYIQEAEKCRIQ